MLPCKKHAKGCQLLWEAVNALQTCITAERGSIRRKLAGVQAVDRRGGVGGTVVRR
jgi:hypothetical protein